MREASLRTQSSINSSSGALRRRVAKSRLAFPAGAGPEVSGRMKIPAAWLIEQSGFTKGYSAGGAGISSKHTLALVNLGGASATEILARRIGLQKKLKNSLEFNWRWSRRC